MCLSKWFETNGIWTHLGHYGSKLGNSEIPKGLSSFSPLFNGGASHLFTHPEASHQNDDEPEADDEHGDDEAGDVGTGKHQEPIVPFDQIP